MGNIFQRSLFININKYQQKILLPALIICLIACLVTLYSVCYISYIDSNLAVLLHINNTQLDQDVPWFIYLHKINKAVPLIHMVIVVVLMWIIFWLYTVSNRLLGPTTRVIHELDQILSGQRKDPIGTRNGDELFEELLKRINQLIKKN